MLYTWRTAIILSVTIHIIIAVVINQKITLPPPLSKESHVLKTYIVTQKELKNPLLNSQSNKAIKVSPPPEQNKLMEKPIKKIAVKKQSVNENKTQAEVARNKTENPKKLTPNHNETIKKVEKRVLDPYKAFEQLSTVRNPYELSKNNGKPAAKNQQPVERITVPKAHQDQAYKYSKILSQTPNYTLYKKGDTCYKVHNIDPNNRSIDSALPSTWLQKPYKCSDKLKKAYDIALDKFLPKKR